MDGRGHAVGRYAGPLPLRRGERLEPRPGRHRGQDHREHPRAGDHQPQQPHWCRLQQADRRGPRRHRTPSPAGRLRRRDLREDPLRRRRPPPRGRSRRPRRALPDLQWPLQGLPGLWLPGGLGDGLGAEGDRHRLPRGPHPHRQHADVRQRARPARHPDRAGGLPVHRGADRPRGPLLRAEHAGRQAPQRHPGRLLGPAAGRALLLPPPRPRVYAIEDDQQFVIDLLRSKKILVTHGTGFNWPEPDHFRLVTLPDVALLEEAIGRIAEFLATRR